MRENSATKITFDGLFTFEMANNHQGSVSHGKRIIQEMANLAKEFNVSAAIKIQMRDLPSFIHPAFRERKDVKHIPRFQSTKLSLQQFGELVNETHAVGLIAMATPFDEMSVDSLCDLGVDIIKVASCSAHDWPLLEKISSIDKPVICSVGGLSLREIDKVVSFFEHRGSYFALMHCVAIYPTPNDQLHLNQISLMKVRYPKITIGFSTHEEPDNTAAIGLAYARGARIFEKHVGVPTENITLNAYSANPEQLRRWLQSYKDAVAAIGSSSERIIGDSERKGIKSLVRGVYARKDIPAGVSIGREDVYFAMPCQENQLISGKFLEGLVVDRDYKKDEMLNDSVVPDVPTKRDIIYSAVHAAKGMLNEAMIPLSHDFQVEISHHYGLKEFHKVGCMIIDCINREYAKKILIQFPGQFHPTHYHKVKDETFQVLYGQVEVEIEGKRKMLTPGDTIWIPRGVWHSFWTDTGVIIEEVSTTSYERQGDSFYIDKKISSIPRDERKTRLLNWGRHQFDEVV